MTIYHASPSYPEKRMIIDKCPDVHYVRTHILTSVLDKLHVHGTGCDALGLLRLSQCLGRGSGLHLFNTVAGWPFKTPFVTTFESIVPYTYARDFWFRRGLDGLKSPACKRLLAICECTRQMQLRFNAEYGLNEINDKIMVLHPPQKTLVARSEIVEKDFDKGPLRFAFVGANFARKGGGEILRVFNKLRKDFEVDLTLIGDIDSSDGGYMHHPIIDSGDSFRKLIDGREWVHYYRRVPNAQVLDMLKDAHVGLLPTRSDTYGYSVLEMQAAGLPCITSDIRALPEINSNVSGWIFGVEKNLNGNFPEPNAHGIERLSPQIEAGLEQALRDAYLHRDQIRQKALHAYDRIVKDHNPVNYAASLRKVYEESFA